MNGLIVFFFGVAATFLQCTLLRGLFPLDFVPDIILLFVLYTSLSFPYGSGLVLAFSLGLTGDLFSGAPEGWYTLYAIVFFMIIKAIQARIFLRGLRGAFALLLLAFGLKLAYFLLLALVAGFCFPSFKDTVLIWLGELFSSLLLMPVIFYLVSRSLGVEGLWILQNQKIHAP